jgi:hypothetical protein
MLRRVALVRIYKSHTASHPRKRYSSLSPRWKPQILHSINWLGSVAEKNVAPVRYELSFYIPEDGILHSHRRENLKFYIALTGWAL